jgi:hypothetical protein
MTSKDDSSGLLSRVVRFVRNPTKDRSGLDTPERVSGYSKQALKEMIERKRRNDFVRQREFNQLRKLRRNEPVISPGLADRPSFFQSSMASNPDERAMTLKKIDDIEAQMSRQWWKNRQNGASVHGGTSPLAPTPPSRAAAGGGPAERVSAFEPTQVFGSELGLERLHFDDYEATQMGLPAPDDIVSVQRLQSASASADSRNPDTGPGEFSIPNLLSMESEEVLADPDLEEAAIRFANGDEAGAEVGLLTALQADNVHPDTVDGWAMALFDLYRGTGQRANFDRVAMDYARRFERSAPAWFSTPELLGRPVVKPAPDQAAVPTPGKRAVWECPAELDFQAVQALCASAAGASAPLHLDWNRLHTITPDAAQALAGLFGEWCLQPVKLFFEGVDVLEKVLRRATPSGDRQVAGFWWCLRLDALRVLRLQDEFELAALDYCVTYEVSPPPWVDALCECIHERTSVTAPSANVKVKGASGDAVAECFLNVDQAYAETVGLDAAPAAVVELSGEVLGDAAAALDLLQAGLHGADRLVISCARLIRVDFSAAGSILNWVAVRELEGCRVQFHDVPRLVAVFFNVIGINEHARIVPRTR